MPEYLSPGVYVEEVSYRQKTIEGVSTSTAGFVGPARTGPTSGEPVFVTNLGEFERVFGSLDDLQFGATDRRTNYLAQGVRAFFEEGGQRLYVARIYEAPAARAGAVPTGVVAGRLRPPGFAMASIGDPRLAGAPVNSILVGARHPGSGGNVTVRFIARIGGNAFRQVELSTAPGAGLENVLRGVRPFDVARVRFAAASPPGVDGLYRLVERFDPTLGRMAWELEPETGTATIPLASLRAGDEVRVVTVNVEVLFYGSGERADTVVRREIWEDLALDPEHDRGIGRVMRAQPERRADVLNIPIVFDAPGRNGQAIGRVLFTQPRTPEEQARLDARAPMPAPVLYTILDRLEDARLSEVDRVLQIRLVGGADGGAPTAAGYEGVQAQDPRNATGLRTFEHVADISIVAAPGASHGAGTDATVRATASLLIAHAERMRYRIAVLDSPLGASLQEIRDFKARYDSSHAALYYPWVEVLDPVTNRPVPLPPSGAIAGIYARNDVERGVHKAPANEVLRTALNLQQLLNKAHQDVLNPEGINCSRFFEGRGFRVWGARTISSDGEWKYVNLRRYFAYLERSIELGTQWAVFEPNGDTLWRNVRQTIEDFLFSEWQNDRLFGLKPSDAFFVRCDRSTMSQNDIDNGRMVCRIGVAPLRPAEFVIFRIGQWTADRRS